MCQDIDLLIIICTKQQETDMDFKQKLRNLLCYFGIHNYVKGIDFWMFDRRVDKCKNCNHRVFTDDTQGGVLWEHKKRMEREKRQVLIEKQVFSKYVFENDEIKISCAKVVTLDNNNLYNITGNNEFFTPVKTITYRVEIKNKDNPQS